MINIFTFVFWISINRLLKAAPLIVHLDFSANRRPLLSLFAFMKEDQHTVSN